MASIKNGRDYKHIENNEGYDVIGSGGPFAKASEYLFDGESVLFGRKGTIDTPLFVSKKFWTVDTMFYSVIEPDIIAKYLYYSATIIPFKYLATQTALPSMTQFDLENHVLACPNKNEQEEIVTYIEKKLNRIDNMVRINKDAIDVYGEYRNSLVTAAVTGKIDVRDFSLNKGVA